MFSAAKIMSARDRALGRYSRSESDLPLADLCEALMLERRPSYRFTITGGVLSWASGGPAPRFTVRRLQRFIATLPELYGHITNAPDGSHLEMLPQEICDDIQFTLLFPGEEVAYRDWEDVEHLTADIAIVTAIGQLAGQLAA